jgi:transcriptional regulator with XRE-family HTH domain
MDLSGRLRTVRKALELNQSDFAKSLGIKQGSYSGLETGAKKTLSGAVRELLHLQYGVNVSWLETGEGEMFLDKLSVSEVLKEPEAEYKKETPDPYKRIKELESLVETQKYLIGLLKEKVERHGEI